MLTADVAGSFLEAHPLESGGAPLHRAAAVMVALHGRGGDPASILAVGEALAQPDVAFLAPGAEGRTWYPRSFLAPTEENEPFLSASLRRVGQLLQGLIESGVPPARLGVMGFSQGACLGLEALLRHGKPIGAVIAFSGGYIGPLGPPRVVTGDLTGTTAFLGCSEVDPHIPVGRFRETAALLTQLGARVTAREYPGMGHTINRDEIAEARRVLLALRGPNERDT